MEQQNVRELVAAMRGRRSVRTFDGEAVDAQTREALEHFAAQCGNPYEIPVTFRLLDASLPGLTSTVVTGETLYVAAKVARVPHADEAFGYAFESLLLYAHALGLGTAWLGGTLNREAFSEAMELSKDEIMPAVSPIGRPAEKKSFRESMMRKALKADSRLPFETLFYDGDWDTPLTAERAGEAREALELLRLAPSAANRQPWRVLLRDGKVHFYLQRSKGFAAGETGDMQRVDLGIALCHFDLAAQARGMTPRFLLEDPGLTTEMTYIASYQL